MKTCTFPTSSPWRVALVLPHCCANGGVTCYLLHYSNECVDGTFAIAAMTNRLSKQPCRDLNNCVNFKNGTFGCCEPGFWNPDIINSQACVDIDECATGAHTCRKAHRPHSLFLCLIG